MTGAEVGKSGRSAVSGWRTRGGAAPGIAAVALVAIFGLSGREARAAKGLPVAQGTARLLVALAARPYKATPRSSFATLIHADGHSANTSVGVRKSSSARAAIRVSSVMITNSNPVRSAAAVPAMTGCNLYSPANSKQAIFGRALSA